MAGWLEFWLLRRSLIPRIGTPTIGPAYLATLWACAAAAAAAAWMALVIGAEGWPVLPRGLAVLGVFGLGYLALAWAARVPEAMALAPGGRRDGR